MSTHLAHIDDPSVSIEAAINLSPVASAKVMQVIADLIHDHGPLTPTELERIYHQKAFVNNWPRVALRSVAKRASEMKKHLGVLKGTGVRRDRAEALTLSTDLMTVYTRITDHWEKDA